jgi:heme exporter protein CcmD
MALTAAIDDPRRADKAGGLLLLVGVVNIPIIYFSVKWWNTLHQGSSVNLTKSSMAETMLWGMLLMAMCFWMYSIAVALMRVRTIMLERERHTDWVKAELANSGPGTKMIHWNSFSDFLAMGGYGLYVWGSFGVTALIMAIEPIMVARNRKITVARLKRQLRAESRAGNRNTE